MSADARVIARAQELLSRARNGEITYTAFLTPAEQHALARAMPWAKGEMLADGGYAAAERARIFFLPPYLLDMDGQTLAECLADTREECLIPLEIRGSGYRELSHRDFLGALLHLGVERDRIGDICVLSPDHAILFCDRVMANFFVENLSSVANDAVRLSTVTLPVGFDGGRRFEGISDTVASPRADAVVAALANLSREKAQALFREARVEIDYEPEARTDRTVDAGAVIVIRGCGKFIIRSLSDKTRKGRYRLLADRYV
jgi:RNA-binding protein YlmH